MPNDLCERLDSAEQQLCDLNWKELVPDDLQSAVRMEFNEALAGGPNMNGDAGPELTVNHAKDCIWATRRIAALVAEIERQRATITQLKSERDEALDLLNHPAVTSSLKMLRTRYEKARCDDEAVSCCVNCNTLFLVKTIERARTALSESKRS